MMEKIERQQMLTLDGWQFELDNLLKWSINCQSSHRLTFYQSAIDQGLLEETAAVKTLRVVHYRKEVGHV